MIGALAAAGAVVGGIAGAQGNNSNQNQSQVSSVRMRDIKDLNKGRSALEAAGDDQSLSQFNSLAGLVNAGPGQQAVTDAGAWDQTFMQQLQTMLNGPTSGQITQAQGFAQSMFDPQRVQMQQAFKDQEVQSNRLAARLGRAGNDPILRNKLAQEQTRQSAQLNANQGAFAAQYAQQLPQNYLSMGSALSNLKNGLATQAFQNRQALLTMGQQLTSAERNYRLNTATKIGNTNTQGSSGGGFAGAIGGALAGAGGAMDFMGKFGTKKTTDDTGGGETSYNGAVR